MDDSLGILALLLILGFTSYQGHRSPSFRDHWIFDVERIRLRREYHRLLTCCGLHADLMHFAFNAITIYLFGTEVAYAWGGPGMLIIFLVSVLSGSLLSYWLNRYDDYRSLGASGGACGLIFASILLFPGMSVSLGLIPVFVPSWIYATLFIAGSYYAHRNKKDNIGHIAHLGGALGGILATALYAPSLLIEAPWTTWLSFSLLLAVCLYLALWPQGISGGALTTGLRGHRPNLRYQRYDEAARKNADLRRMDTLLDKITQGGSQGLKPKERAELETLSRRYRPRDTPTG